MYINSSNSLILIYDIKINIIGTNMSELKYYVIYPPLWAP